MALVHQSRVQADFTALLRQKLKNRLILERLKSPVSVKTGVCKSGVCTLSWFSRIFRATGEGCLELAATDSVTQGGDIGVYAVLSVPEKEGPSCTLWCCTAPGCLRANNSPRVRFTTELHED